MERINQFPPRIEKNLKEKGYFDLTREDRLAAARKRAEALRSLPKLPFVSEADKGRGGDCD